MYFGRRLDINQHWGVTLRRTEEESFQSPFVEDRVEIMVVRLKSLKDIDD